MDFSKIRLMYFSPTGTTQRVLESIARGIAGTCVEQINLTLPNPIKQPLTCRADELIVLGAPVYGGRLPGEAIRRFRLIKGENALAVVVVVYGNREFEDALLELKDLAVELGFLPVAGGAFIGEHSFASAQAPIATGRPDALDIEKAMVFGAGIRKKIETMHSSAALPDLGIPGRFPYEGGPRSMSVTPVTRAAICTFCGNCAGVCPTAAIAVNDVVKTKTEACIRCCACVKSCPTGARVWDDETMATITNWLKENCRVRKEPQIFGVEPS